MAGRRGRSEDSIYYDHKAPCCDPDEHRRCSGSWRGVISLGYGPDGKRIRRKVRMQEPRPAALMHAYIVARAANRELMAQLNATTHRG
jgi:hypothetical protein